MGGEWIECPLADACRSIDYGLTASASKHEVGLRFLRITDIATGQIDWKTVPHVAADEATAVKYRLHDGDIVLARTGASTGASAYLKSPPPAVFASYLVRLQAKPEFDARFLAYYLKTDEFWTFIRGVLGDKSAQPNASASTMTKAPLRAPKDKGEQRAIAHILGTLDDRIVLNRRMNETLEAMARALFKSWFVDFDPVRAKMEGRWQPGQSLPGLPAHLYDLFPDRLVESELGEIPEGWRLATLEEVAERVAMGPFGSSIRVDTFVPDGVPVISGQHLRGTLLEDSVFNFVSIEHADRLARSNVGRGDVVFTHAGSIGQVALIPPWSRYSRYVISQRQFYMRCNLAVMSPLYPTLYFKTPEGRHRLLANTSSTGVPSISQPVTYLKGLLLLVPPVPLISTFDSLASSFYHRAAAGGAESLVLAAIRDTLLPKLISGELRVDAQKILSLENASDTVEWAKDAVGSQA